MHGVCFLFLRRWLPSPPPSDSSGWVIFGARRCSPDQPWDGLRGRQPPTITHPNGFEGRKSHLRRNLKHKPPTDCPEREETGTGELRPDFQELGRGLAGRDLYPLPPPPPRWKLGRLMPQTRGSGVLRNRPCLKTRPEFTGTGIVSTCGLLQRSAVPPQCGRPLGLQERLLHHLRSCVQRPQLADDFRTSVDDNALLRTGAHSTDGMS